MRSLRSIPVLNCLWAMCLTVCLAGAAQAADRDRLEAFLEVTGFGVALDSIALSAADAPEMLGMSATDFGADWTIAANNVFDTDKMREMALDILEATLEDGLLIHAAEFYASPLGQRLVEVENSSHLVEDDAAKHAEGAALVDADVAEGAGRSEILRQLNQAVDASGTGVRAIQEIQVRFLMAASRSGVVELELDEATLRALLREDESELKRSLQAAGLAYSSYTYRDISKSDLRDYLAALENPKMQRVYELMNAVQYEITANRFEALAVKMAELHPGQEL